MKIDAITIEIIKNSLIYITEEMGISLRKSAYSHNIKERMDHSCAIFDSKMRLIAQAEHIPVHLGSMPYGVKCTLTHFNDELRQFDMLIFNEPYISGTHLNDITLLKPIFYKNTFVGYCVNKSHHVDVGGMTPGSMSPIATEIYQEGLIIPPVKIMRNGKLVDDVLSIILANVRTPQIAAGDIRAQIAANNLGERRVLELIDKYGIETFEHAIESILNYSESQMRQQIKVIPDGVYTGEDCMEDITGNPLLLRVVLKIKNDSIHVDYRGTCAQVKKPLNAVFGVTLASTYYVIKSILCPEIPANEGTFRPITVHAPVGSLLNPTKPYPVAGGNVETSQRIADTLFKAFAKVLPHKVPAACCGTMNNVIVGGHGWVFYETIGGGSGARYLADGVDGIHCNMTNTMNTPIEVIEQYYPILFMKYEFRENSFGKGKWHGGCGIDRAWKLLSSEATVSILADRIVNKPWGLAGGSPGDNGEYIIKRSTGEFEKLNGKTVICLKKDDILFVRTPGGGGYGTDSKKLKSF
jgi:N-methylhydantoinase B